MIADIAVILIFAIWIALSLLVHVPRLKDRIRGWNIFSIIPEWTFFAPMPAQWDYHLLFRDQLESGEISPWTEVQPEPRTRLNVIWNPGRRWRKAFFDIVTELSMHIRDAADNPSIGIEASIPYLTILNYISLQQRFVLETDRMKTQCLVMYSFGSTSELEPKTLFISGLHEL